MLECLEADFPSFYYKINAGILYVEHIELPLSQAEIKGLEALHGLILPDSFKRFLQCTRHIWIGDSIKVGTHLFSFIEGTLCFGDYFWKADGDQVLFDVSHGLTHGEYPILYFEHDFADRENHGLMKIADSFGEWIESL